jgi:hypothetical protein
VTSRIFEGARVEDADRVRDREFGLRVRNSRVSVDLYLIVDVDELFGNGDMISQAAANVRVQHRAAVGDHGKPHQMPAGISEH